MRKKLLLLLILLGLLGGAYLFRTEERSMPQQIAHALAEKNNWGESDVKVTILTYEGNYAKGSLKLKDQMGGGLWFAAKVNGVWTIVHDGNGIVTCDQLTAYPNFPKNIIPSCYDTHANQLVTR